MNLLDYIPSGKETDVRLLTVYISVNTMEEVKKCIMNIYSTRPIRTIAVIIDK